LHASLQLQYKQIPRGLCKVSYKDQCNQYYQYNQY